MALYFHIACGIALNIQRPRNVVSWNRQVTASLIFLLKVSLLSLHRSVQLNRLYFILVFFSIETRITLATWRKLIGCLFLANL